MKRYKTHCPIRFKGEIICIETSCTWYDESEKKCVVFVIADRLKKLGEQK